MTYDAPRDPESRSTEGAPSGPPSSSASSALEQANTFAVAVSWYADATLHRIAYVGPMAIRLLGFPASAWYEEDFWATHLPVDEQESVQRQRQRYVANGADFELNYHMIASDGSLVRMRELATVSQSADGSAMLRGLFLRNDRTPFSAATPGSASSFGSWLSHELSQPLGVILANATAMRHLLQASPPRVDEALEALADIAQGARDAASLLAVARRSLRDIDVTPPATTDSQRAK
ncbi:MAG TPA: PAS domain-containing protein [Gemmatimonadaceae bacterium]|nr:PAS domain-containing protein [Gemmatimonadaceae bacterium]